MADRDWDKELAKVDKQLASLSDDALLGPPPATTGKKEVPSGKKAPAPSAPVAARATSSWSVYGRLILSLAVGVAMLLWPYPARCGVGLERRRCRLAAASGDPAGLIRVPLYGTTRRPR